MSQREIKFRAKDIKTGEWRYGFIYRHDPPLQCFGGGKEKPAFAIIKTGFADWNMPRPIDQYEVDGNTLGQFIGLKDKNRVELYQKDIIKYISENDGESVFISGVDASMCSGWSVNDNQLIMEFGLYEYGLSDGNFEIIGNIYDNPELIPTKE